MESISTGYIDDSALPENDQRWLVPATHLPAPSPGSFPTPANGQWLIYQLPETKHKHLVSITVPDGHGVAWGGTFQGWMLDSLPIPGATVDWYFSRGVNVFSGTRTIVGGTLGVPEVTHGAKYLVIYMSATVNLLNSGLAVNVQVFSRNDYDRRLDNEHN